MVMNEPEGIDKNRLVIGKYNVISIRVIHAIEMPQGRIIQHMVFYCIIIFSAVEHIAERQAWMTDKKAVPIPKRYTAKSCRSKKTFKIRAFGFCHGDNSSRQG